MTTKTNHQSRWNHRNYQPTIDKCPICGGTLEATRTHYTSGVVIRLREPDQLGIEIVDEGDEVLTPVVEAIYCENDCQEAAIIAALREGAK